MATSTPMFPPTLREVMLRPKWIGMLLFALVVAGVFAWLGQWQFGRAIDLNPPPAGVTEKVQPLTSTVDPGEYLADPVVGQRVSASGSFVAGDFAVVSGRYNDGVAGFWVAGQYRLADTARPASIAVVVGFTPDRAAADAAVARLNAAPPQNIDVLGRLIPDEGAAPPSRSQAITEMSRMSTAQLLNLWHEVDGVGIYRPYLTAQQPMSGLLSIDSPAPDQQSPINWLNVFYAVEWAVFAGFAFYLWYRLAKDECMRETEAFEEARAAAN